MNVGSIVEYCIIEYSRGGVDVAEGTGDSVLVSHNIMRHNLWTGLAIHSSSPTITYNEILESGGHQGIDILGEGSAPLIAYNILRDNKVGIVVQSGTAPIVENNTLTDNDAAILVIDSISTVIRGNTIKAPTGAHNDWSYQGQTIYPNIAKQNYNEVTGINILNASPMVYGNQIAQCPNGITFHGNSSPEIRHNTVTSSINNGLFFDETFMGSPIIHENNFYENSCNLGSISLQPIDASENWWGTTDAEKITKRIQSQGPIKLEPYLIEPVGLQ